MKFSKEWFEERVKGEKDLDIGAGRQIVNIRKDKNMVRVSFVCRESDLKKGVASDAIELIKEFSEPKITQMAQNPSSYPADAIAGLR